MLDSGQLIFQNEKCKKLLQAPQFLEAWDKLYHDCPWATVFQSKEFALNWYQCFESFPKIIVTDWDGIRMTGLLALTKKNNQLTAAGLDLAEYQVWLSLPNFNDEFLKKALLAINITFPNQTLYLKYLTAKVPLNLFFKKGPYGTQTFIREYAHPLMETNEELLKSELKKKNKKEKINRLKRLGDLEFFEVKENDHFRALIDEMSLLSDFRKGAFYNKTYFYDEPERKTFLLKLFELGLLHVSGLSIDGKLIASNAGIMGPDVVHLQGINSHSPFYSKNSPGILQFLMLGIALKKSGFKYFDLTPGDADGYKSMLATEISMAYEMWFTSKTDATMKKWFERVKNWLKPRFQEKTFRGFELSNLNMARIRFKFKCRFLKKSLRNHQKKEFTNFLKGESQFFSLKDPSPITEKIEAIGVIHENQISDLFLFDEEFSLFPRMDFFADCITRIEFGQNMFTLVSGSELMGVFWFISMHAKTEWKNTRVTPQLPTLTCSYAKNIDSDKFNKVIEVLQQQIQNKQPEISHMQLEIGGKQKELLKKS
ncbi:GNAT family N-acetyltransferase [Aquiflexum lacus]|uniref:GNAT family N-acetyltransferase n=1 Tax=Aquiflexum lacus TaxID=2483805 RepID=UPI0018956A94|nr:GNAT family N-acetyltransferase [Aquiflexum lacus]